MGRLKKHAALGAVACAFVGGFEGLRTTAYPDPATKGPPWTVCYGQTMGVKKGDKRSVEECKADLINGLDGYGAKVEACTRSKLSDEEFIAYTSFAWNLGPGVYCSKFAPQIDRGDRRGACDRLLKYNRAAGIVFPGLTRRRVAERDLCIKGI